jgi:hypothetical protein
MLYKGTKFVKLLGIETHWPTKAKQGRFMNTPPQAVGELDFGLRGRDGSWKGRRRGKVRGVTRQSTQWGTAD